LGIRVTIPPSTIVAIQAEDLRERRITLGTEIEATVHLCRMSESKVTDKAKVFRPRITG
jgi:hypothetical protein